MALAVKCSPANVREARDVSLILGLGRSPGVGNGSNMLSWKIPWKEEPGGLQSKELLRVRYN